MDSIFCCSYIEPFKPRIIDNEAKFKAFLNWARTFEPTSANTALNALENSPFSKGSCFVIQVVRQVNYGPLESKRYFVQAEGMGASFNEVTEQDLINANFEKVNSYKNYRCDAHNKFFELNLYQKDPVNRHHWRANIARPATQIDIPSVTTNPVGSMSKVDLLSESFAQLDAAHVGDLDSIQSMGNKSKVNSTSMAYSTPATFSPAAESSQSFKVDETAAGGLEKGPLRSGEGLGSLDSQKSYKLENEEVEYLHDDDQSGGDNYISSCGSQSPQDFTACSADDCGYCGHCTY